MPELPEVETVVRDLRPDLIGRTIQSAWLDWPKSLKVLSPEAFTAQIAGQTCQNITRRGKYILCGLDHDTLIIHLKMTGRLYVTPDDGVHHADKWVHFKFQLDKGHQLRFSDARKFGMVYLTPEPEWVVGKLGPEPLEDAFTLDVFKQLLARRSGTIKPLLLNQTFIAGVGNIYADEALHRAGIHPLRTANTLAASEQARLYEGIRAALNKGIEHEGSTINWYRKPDGSKGNTQHYLFTYGRTGEPCRTCAHPIERIRVGGRSTHYCPTCQPRKIL